MPQHYPPTIPNDLTKPLSYTPQYYAPGNFNRNNEDVPDVVLSPINERVDATGSRTFAIGSIDGCLDPLVNLVEKIINEAPLASNDTLLFLGDYIGEGGESKGVLTYLRKLKNSPIKTVFLRGDMDHRFHLGSYDFLISDEGTATLDSYVGISSQWAKRANSSQFATNHLDVNSLQEDRDFIGSFLMYKEDPKVFYCHGGLSGAKEIADQTKGSLMFIKQRYSESQKDYGKNIVTSGIPVRMSAELSPKASIKGARMNLNTAPAYTGKIACASILDKTGELQDVMYGEAS